MKLVAQASVLANAVTLAATAMRRKPLARVVTADDAVSVTCSDNHIAISANAAATVLEPGAVALSADRLAAVTSGFPASAMVTMSTAEGAAAVVCGNSRSRLAIVPWTDLPSVLAIESEIGRVEISGSDCLMLLEPLPAAASEATRFHLCGIFLHSIGDRLVAVCTDGVRLIRTSVAAGKYSEGRDLIVPRGAAAVLARLVKSTRPGRVTLHRSRTLLAVTGPDFEFTTRLIDCGSGFPAYEAVIPASALDTVTCDRAELVGTLSRLAAVASADLLPLLALSFDSAPQLNVWLARQPADGSDCIAAEANGSAKVAVPLSQLAALIGEFNSERLRIEAAGQTLVLRGDGEKVALISQSHWNFASYEKEAAA